MIMPNLESYCRCPGCGTCDAYDAVMKGKEHMSLTREQWVRMFEAAKFIEREAQKLSDIKKDRILSNVKLIKDNIQSVVGQLE